MLDEFGRYRDDVRVGVMGRHRPSISAFLGRDIAGLSPPTPMVYSERTRSMEMLKDAPGLPLSTPPSSSAATGASRVTARSAAGVSRAPLPAGSRGSTLSRTHARPGGCGTGIAT